MPIQSRKRKRQRTEGDIPSERPAKRTRRSSSIKKQQRRQKQKQKSNLSELVVDYHAIWVESCKILSRRSDQNEKQKMMLRRALVYKLKEAKEKIIELVGEARGQVICQKVRDRLNVESEEHEDEEESDESEDDDNDDDETVESEDDDNDDDETVESEEDEDSGSDDEEESESDDDDDVDSEDSNDNKVENDKSAESEIKMKMAAKGVPLNIQSGFNLVGDVGITWAATNVMDSEAVEYWTEFAEQIDSKKYNLLFDVFKELRDGLKKLSPAKDHQDLEKLMDDEFIRNSIKNGKVDASEFFRIFEGIWSKIKSLHCANEDSEWKQWREEILKKIDGNKGSWGTILAEVLNIFTMKMDRIEYQLEEIREAVEKRIGSNRSQDTKNSKNQAMPM